jgi:hypothetical protein
MNYIYFKLELRVHTMYKIIKNDHFRAKEKDFIKNSVLYQIVIVFHFSVNFLPLDFVAIWWY